MEEGLVLGREVLVVVDAGHGLLGSQRMGQGAGRDVAALIASDSHKEVGAAHASVLQGLDAGG